MRCDIFETGEPWSAWLACVTRMLGTRLPYHEPYWVNSDGPLATIAARHPAFGNCFDWHSSVHMHWSGLRLLSEHPDLPGADHARAVIASNLTTVNLEVEAAFLSAQPIYERPYGRSWALALTAQIETRRPAFLADLDIGGLRVELVASLGAYCDAAVRPERAGQHRNTAFNLLIALRASRDLNEVGLASTIEATAIRLFGEDRDAPQHLEPSGEDFLSPTLAEAHLMCEVLAADAFVEWLDAWLPGLLSDGLHGALVTPIQVPETDDPRTVHLHGLNLSRSFHLGALGDALGRSDRRGIAFALAKANYGPDVFAQAVRGDFASDHWLVTYALLSLSNAP